MVESDITSFFNGSETKDDILLAIRNHHEKIIPIPGLDTEKLLIAIATVETSLGSDNRPRHENAYDQSGLYALKNVNLQQALKKYGALAACSFGPWQIMFIVAKEHGFLGHPMELWRAEISVEYVIRLLNGIIFQGAISIEEIADAWNSGSFKDDNRPLAYMNAVRAAYQNLLS